MSERKAGEAVSVKYPKGRVSPEKARQVYRHRSGGSHDPVAKPKRKQTDTKVKLQLAKVESYGLLILSKV